MRRNWITRCGASSQQQQASIGDLVPASKSTVAVVQNRPPDPTLLIKPAVYRMFGHDEPVIDSNDAAVPKI